jgi:hypothetical protein
VALKAVNRAEQGADRPRLHDCCAVGNCWVIRAPRRSPFGSPCCSGKAEHGPDCAWHAGRRLVSPALLDLSQRVEDIWRLDLSDRPPEGYHETPRIPGNPRERPRSRKRNFCPSLLTYRFYDLMRVPTIFCDRARSLVASRQHRGKGSALQARAKLGFAVPNPQPYSDMGNACPVTMFVQHHAAWPKSFSARRLAE